MVNVTYGSLSGEKSNPSVNPLGTDVVATSDNVISAFDPGDISWILTCAALILFMMPGLGYLYSGLARRKNALSMLFLSMVSIAIVSFQWFFIGYSLAFSNTGGSFFGDGRNVGFRQVLDLPKAETNNKLPELVYATYQLMFACLVPAVLLGAAAERSRILPAMIFIFCWTTLVYDMLAHWIWSVNGWAFKWGVLDYAGGVPVEIASGTGGLAYSYFIGRRRGYGTEGILFKPSNVSQVVLGTVFLWVGWLGFNGGSCFAASIKAAMAVFVTNLAGSVGGIAWLLLDYRLERKWSMVGFCTGAIAGLVAITPAAGFVGCPAGALIGLVSAVLSNFATRLKATMRVDDVMDIFAVHSLAGVVGVLMTGLFAQSSVAANDGFSAIDGGWLDHNYIQLAKQLAWACVGLGYTFVVTLLIMFVINLIPGCHFRASEEAEIVGMDEVELGEYVADYAFVERDLEGNCVVDENGEASGGPSPPPGSAFGPRSGTGTGLGKEDMDELSRTRTRVREKDVVGNDSAEGSSETVINSEKSSRSRSRGRSRARDRDALARLPEGEEVEMGDVRRQERQQSR